MSVEFAGFPVPMVLTLGLEDIAGQPCYPELREPVTMDYDLAAHHLALRGTLGLADSLSHYAMFSGSSGTRSCCP